MDTCKFCGKPLVEGAVCDCPAAMAEARKQPPPPPPVQYEDLSATEPVPAAQEEQTEPEAPASEPQFEFPPSYHNPHRRRFGTVAAAAKHMLQTCMGLLLHPAQTLEGIRESGQYTHGLAFLVIKAVVLPVFTVLTLLIFIIGNYGIRGSFMSAMDFLLLFARVFSISIISDAAFLTVSLAAGKIFGSPAGIRGHIGVIGTATAPLTVSFVLICIFFLISPGIGFMIGAVFLCYCASLGLQALSLSLQLGKDQMMWALTIILIVMLLIFYFTGNALIHTVFQKLFGIGRSLFHNLF